MFPCKNIWGFGVTNLNRSSPSVFYFFCAEVEKSHHFDVGEHETLKGLESSEQLRSCPFSVIMRVGLPDLEAVKSQGYSSPWL